MSNVSRRWILAVLLLGCGIPSVAQKAAPPPLVYKGTVGHLHVTFWLEAQGESLRGGHYRYDGQKTDIPFDEVRVFGTTAVLEDEDENTFHLHMKSASGGGITDWARTVSLEGTLVRGDLDLPVLLSR